jgi:predicted AlkP superfamily pyrophosphatase or phosphodiesterase
LSNYRQRRSCSLFLSSFWYSTVDGGFASSTYYFDEFPQWVYDWNAQKKADRYYDTTWDLTNDIATYRAGARDDRRYETVADLGFGRVFPHTCGPKGNKYYYSLLLGSPVGDELTLDFAKEIIRNEKLGQDDVPDYLAIGLSSTDYVGHTFGPASLETEDNLLRLDRTLADLFAYVDEAVGLENTLIVLSSDHGTPEAAEYMTEKGLEAGRINLDDGTAIEATKTTRWPAGPRSVRSRRDRRCGTWSPITCAVPTVRASPGSTHPN